MLNKINAPPINMLLYGMLSDNRLMYKSNIEEIQNYISENESLVDYGSAVDIIDCYFDDAGSNGDYTSVYYKYQDNEVYFGGDEWEWNNFYLIGIGDYIIGPPKLYHYNGPHGIKHSVDEIFEIIFQFFYN